MRLNPYSHPKRAVITNMDILRNHRIIDTLFQQWQPYMGDNYLPYRNHVLRIVNYARALSPLDKDSLEQVIIAACFHDVELWLSDTWDYLKPSAQRANNYLVREGKSQWSDAVVEMIQHHHKITRYSRSNGKPGNVDKNGGFEKNSDVEKLVELFRKADWIDVSLGQLRFGLPKTTLKEIRKAFPQEGFPQALAKEMIKNCLKNPLKPLPMFHW